MSDKKYGFIKLAQKSLTVLTAFIAVVHGKSEAFPHKIELDDDNKWDYRRFQDQILKRKLVLKLNIGDATSSKLSWHASHSSHSSHSSHYSSSMRSGHYSHSSHASHSSHYSSSPSYAPYKSSSPKVDAIHNNAIMKLPRSQNANGIVGQTPDSLGSRILYKGCRGSDVEELQRILVFIKYNLRVTGYFDEVTERIIKDFQRKSSLEIDGIVGKETLIYLKQQAWKLR
jgi:hypothetical protein